MKQLPQPTSEIKQQASQSELFNSIMGGADADVDRLFNDVNLLGLSIEGHDLATANSELDRQKDNENVRLFLRQAKADPGKRKTFIDQELANIQTNLSFPWKQSIKVCWPVLPLVVRLSPKRQMLISKVSSRLMPSKLAI